MTGDDVTEQSPEGLLNPGLSRIDDLDLSWTGRQLLRGFLAAQRRSGQDDVEALGQIDRLRRDLRTADAELAAQQDQLTDRAWALVSREIDAGWWRLRERTLNAVRRRGQAGEARALWLAAWCSALAADAWQLCDKIASSAADAEEAIAGNLKTIAAYLTVSTDDQSSTALEWLQESLDAALRDPTLSEEAVLVLGCLQARVMLRRGADPRPVIESELLDPSGRSNGGVLTEANRGYWRALAMCVRAEVALANGDTAATNSLLAEASTARVVPADVAIVTGLLHERSERWLLANVEYDQAVENKADPGRIALLRPTPSGLCLRWAELHSEDDPRASLDLVDGALSQGVQGEAYAEAAVYELKGRLLVTLDRTAEASDAYLQAGIQHSWASRGSRAIDAFRRSCTMSEAEPEPWWRLAEELRVEATDAYDRVDRRVLAEAERAMDVGLGRRRPDESTAWAWLTYAMITSTLESLGETTGRESAVLSVERALLLQPDRAATYGFLAMLLKRAGLITQALEVVEQGYRLSESSLDEMVSERFLELLLDVGDDHRALDLVRRRGEERIDPAQHSWELAVVHRRFGRFDEALEALRDADPTNLWTLTSRATLLSEQGDEEEALQEFGRVLEAARADGREDIAGWAAYRTGRFDEAIETYGALTDHAPSYTSYSRDLGQMYLARGNRETGDLLIGAQLLIEGIATCTSASDLHVLAAREFDALRCHVRQRPHQRGVEAVLQMSEQLAGSRTDQLLKTRDAGTLWAQLAAGREATRRNDLVGAFRCYLELSQLPELASAELDSALLQATVALFAEADVAIRDNRVDEAVRCWNLLDQATDAVADGDVLAVALAARRVINAVVAGQPPPASALDSVLAHPHAIELMSEATRVFALDAERLWNLYDTVVQLGAATPLDADAVSRLLADLPYDTVYRLGRDEQTKKHVSTPVPRALEIRYGVAVRELEGGLRREIDILRGKLADRMGVRIHAVKCRVDETLGATTVEIFVWEQRAQVLTIADSATAVEQIIEDLESVLLAQLYRLIGPDDVRLWLKGWEVSASSESSVTPADSHADRIRLVRVLRMLLREGVPVKGRDLIVSRFLLGESLGHFPGPLDALRKVRLELGVAELTGAQPVEPQRLPTDLEERVRAGFDSTDGERWELPRSEAASLVADLRRWIHDPDPARDIVMVENALTRPFVWRLLAADRPSVRVLSAEEVRA